MDYIIRKMRITDKELDTEVFMEIGRLYDKIIDTLRLKYASKKVIGKTWWDIGGYIHNCTNKISVDCLLKDLKEKHHNLQLADEEQVKQMDIFLPGYKKPELSHLEFEEGGLRNVDEYPTERLLRVSNERSIAKSPDLEINGVKWPEKNDMILIPISGDEGNLDKYEIRRVT